ncbi:uncharacterized protein LOC131680819 [Topomyia yanbarensis]|uniref:uncharacterized protein LOC131680819 n=1 Tax=Topomyia yanbarensis TaxID=2498891 RepID=UPI00273B2DED|nr:uncharacterized protein LOC131680819 [Topomyia yanbarensis]
MFQFSECGIGLFELITFSIEELQCHLQQTDADWKIEVIFEAISSWRKRNKSAILSALTSNELPGNGGANEPCESSGSVLNTHALEREQRGLLLTPVNESTDSGIVSTKTVGCVPLEIRSQIDSDSLCTGNESSKILDELELLDVSQSTPSVSSNGEAELATASVSASFNDGIETNETERRQEKQNNEEHPPYSSDTVFSPSILAALLKNSEEGKDILRRSTLGELSEAKQLALAGIIAKYHLATKDQLRVDDLERYALAITTIFKSERKV